MPVGKSQIQKASQEQAAAKAAGSALRSDVFFFRFKLDDGETAEVRFLEDGDGLHTAWGVQFDGVGGRMGPFVLTRDQKKDGSVKCPLTEAGMKLKLKLWVNLIWFNAPVYKTDPKTNRMVKNSRGQYVMIGREDRVAVWETGIQNADRLLELDELYGGLTSRPFKITRDGTGLATEYKINPADPDGGPKKMLVAERKLARTKTDLSPLIRPKPSKDIRTIMGQFATDGATNFDPMERNVFDDDE